MARSWMKLSGVALVGVVAGMALAPHVLVGAEQPSSPADTFRNLKLFGDVFERVRSEYVEPVSDQKLIESAINGMLTSLDPHSSYLNADQYRDMQVQTKGEFGGLGIEVTMDNGLVKVVSPIDDTPASKAGIQAGDIITQIDNEAVMGLTLNDAVEKMRGPIDSKIQLTLVRQGHDDPINVSLNRAVIKVSPVRAKVEGDVAYLRLTQFTEQSTSNMVDKIEEMKKQLGPNMRGLVLDLRNDPGGLLDQAVSVADTFIDKGEIVSTRGRRPDSIQRFSAKPGDILNGMPMVVLINGGSASASEIVAGALQDHRRAIIMGTQSFGKGSVQTIMPIPGQGAIRLTTARYYTPAGTSIQGKGITPDIEVHEASVSLKDDTGGRHEADLRGALVNTDKPSPDAQKSPSGDTAGNPLDSEDYQLARAIDILRGISMYEGRATGSAAARAQ
ncbi:carboxyl-terminal processing protease [Arboricoccus pini]|uniref:Carboxyl-terminal processing protease n=1 Tax=Arboricoccus pini TaxID=1963835 RepID=A0A212QXZ4_9PROT|nr:S41 family peptidase [Arboricoccus pini]SNB64628.1 carboxyl-terminal processing protease [Arboricoccus pini]